LLIQAANLLVTYNSKLIPFQLCYLHYQNKLTLGWHSVTGCYELHTPHRVNQVDQISIMAE
jgi:hypothetical protein